MISMAICIILFTMTIVTYTTLVPKDSSQNTKLIAIVGGFSFSASIVAYALALYHFRSNPTYLIHFLLGVVMLVLLPSSLMSVAVSTVTVSNLRDTLASGK